jgi:bla regulator protein blaR1
MISAMIEAALRSLLLAISVWTGLRAFRVRNVLAQKAAWGLVLAAALLMPLLAPLAVRWQILPANATVVLPAHPQSAFVAFWPKPQTSAPLAQQPREPIVAPLPQRESVPAIELSTAPKPSFAPSTGSPSSVISDVYTGVPSGAVSQQSLPGHRPCRSPAWLGRCILP